MSKTNRRAKSHRKLSVPERHQLRVARKTLLMPDAILGVIGGMTKDEAREVIKRLGGQRVH